MKITREGRAAPVGLSALGWDPDADAEDADPPVDRALNLPTFGPDLGVVTALTVPNDGGWTHASDPHAIHAGGITVFGYVDMTNGNIEIRSVPDGSLIPSAPFVLHAALDIDTHAAPAFIFRPDGRIVAAYSAHAGAEFYVRVSTNPFDISAWGAEQTLDATLGGSAYTYPTLAYLNGDLYLWYRTFPGQANMAYSVSSSDGDLGSWSGQTIVYDNGPTAGTSSYWKIEASATRFHISTTNERTATTNVYHFTFDGTTYRQTDGTVISASLPLTAADLTLVYDSSTDGLGWPQDVIPDDDNPIIAYTVVDSGSTNSLRYARWDGAAWVLTTIVSTNGFVDSDGGNVFGGNIALDHLTPSVAYVNVKVGSFWETQQWVTDDDGATWTKAADITSGSSDDNLWVVVIRDHGNELVVIWLYGVYAGAPPYENADMGIKGWGLGRLQQGNTTDDDDATYDAVTGGTDVLRIDLEAAYRIVRARLRIASENAGSRTYSIYGATLADFSDEVLLDSVTFTATGSFTAQDVSFSWADDGIARQYYRLEGTAESRRIHSFELYEASDNLGDYATLDDLDATNAAIEEHVDDTADAHDASAVSVVPFATIAATNVQAALEEIVAEASIPSGHYELLMATGSSPIEPLETGDGLDWLWVWVT